MNSNIVDFLLENRCSGRTASALEGSCVVGRTETRETLAERKQKNSENDKDE